MEALPAFIELLKSNQADRFEIANKIITHRKETANDELEAYHQDLSDRLRNLRYTVPKNIYVGMTSTGLLNAQAILREDGYLVLIDSGCFPLLEVAAWVTIEKLDLRTKGIILADAITQYCEWEISTVDRPAPLKLALEYGPYIDSNVSPVSIDFLVRRAMDFVLAHEYAHIQKGHLTEKIMSLKIAPDKTILVSEKLQGCERSADMWALVALLSKLPDDYDEYGKASACLGPMLFLGVWSLVEEWRRKHGLNYSTHPESAERLMSVQMVCALATLYKYTYAARSFSDVLNYTYEVMFGEPLLGWDTYWNLCRHVESASRMKTRTEIQGALDALESL